MCYFVPHIPVVISFVDNASTEQKLIKKCQIYRPLSNRLLTGNCLHNNTQIDIMAWTSPNETFDAPNKLATYCLRLDRKRFKWRFNSQSIWCMWSLFVITHNNQHVSLFISKVLYLYFACTVYVMMNVLSNPVRSALLTKSPCYIFITYQIPIVEILR